MLTKVSQLTKVMFPGSEYLPIMFYDFIYMNNLSFLNMTHAYQSNSNSWAILIDDSALKIQIKGLKFEQSEFNFLSIKGLSLKNSTVNKSIIMENIVI